MFRVVILTLAYFCIAVNATTVRECKGKPLPLSVTVHDCEEPPCIVYKNQYAVMDVHFLGNKNELRNITTKVTAKVFGVSLPYDLPEEISDVCVNLLYGAVCPIYKDEDVTYRFNFYIDPMFPEITADVTVKLQDEKNNDITCFICSCKIRRGPSAVSEVLLLETEDNAIAEVNVDTE